MRIVHVAQDAIRKNRKTGSKDPALIVRERGKSRRVHSVVVMHLGKVVATFVQSEDVPLACGARVWCEVEDECDVVEGVRWS